MGKPIQYCLAASTVKEDEPFEFPGHDPGPKVAVLQVIEGRKDKVRSFFGEELYTVARICKRCGVIYVPFKEEENEET